MSESTEVPDELDAEFWNQVDLVLNSSHTIRGACRQLLELASGPIAAVATAGRFTEGLTRDLVFRSVAVRAQETFASVLDLIDADRGSQSRTLLRPLVEDHIFVGWLASLSPALAHEFIYLRTLADIDEGVAAQEEFLPDAYSALGVSPTPHEAPGLRVPASPLRREASTRLKALGKPLGWQRRGPSIKDMARAGGKLAEYEFFYLAASRAAHSNLHEIGRMVWGGPDSISISSSPLSPLHENFALTYGAWLYSALLTDLSEHLPELTDVLDSPRWSVWLALVLVGVARNGQLPPIVTERELE
jgi:hypothetical protein